MANEKCLVTWVQVVSCRDDDEVLGYVRASDLDVPETRKVWVQTSKDDTSGYFFIRASFTPAGR
jgi:hypothetical protein